MGRNDEPIMDRIWARIEKTDGCWIWTGAKVNGDYGTTGHRGKQILVHRYLWEQQNGPFPPGTEGGHRCPNGPRRDCVNPDHIAAITHRENVHDAFQGMCARGLHRLDDPAIGVAWPSQGGKRHCRPCRNARVRAYRAERQVSRLGGGP